MQRVFIAGAALVLLAACSADPQKSEAAAPQVAPKAVAAAAPVRQTTLETESSKMAQAAKILAANSIYFDYDDYTVKPQYQETIKQSAALLESLPQMPVTLVGNADERGSTEYNLALGQKRAEAVKKALKLQGVTESQLEAISYGKEKPRATCAEEKCWAENRRVDISARKRVDGK